MPSLQLDLITSHFASLRHRNYQLFWTGRFISQLGTWVQNTAMMWALFERYRDRERYFHVDCASICEAV